MAEGYGRRVIFLALFLTLCFLPEGNSTREWVKEDFPNPTKDPRSCGRRGKVDWIWICDDLGYCDRHAVSLVCDPDKVFSYKTANKVERLLYSVVKNTTSGCSSDEKAGFQIGVAALKKMRSIPGESVEETAEKFTKHLHDSWGVGHAGCDDGTMLLLSILDRQVYVSTGKKAMKFLSDKQIKSIIEEMKPYLRVFDYDTSVELAVVRMAEVFQRPFIFDPIGYVSVLAISVVVLYISCKHGQGLESCGRIQEPFLLDSLYNFKPETENTFVRPSMMGGGRVGSDGGFAGGSSSGGGGSGGSW